MHIDLLIPTRARPDRLRTWLQSIVDTADELDKLHAIIRYDHDDTATIEAISDLSAEFPFTLWVVGERKPLAEYWNDAFADGNSPIVMMNGDDSVFTCKGWDTRVRDFFSSHDPYWLLYGPDGIQNEKLSTHPITTRQAANERKYYVWPEFTMGYVDTWLYEIYQRAGRLHYDEGVGLDHRHFTKFPELTDETYSEQRGERMQYSTKIWRSTVKERVKAARAMQRCMKGYTK